MIKYWFSVEFGGAVNRSPTQGSECKRQLLSHSDYDTREPLPLLTGQATPALAIFGKINDKRCWLGVCNVPNPGVCQCDIDLGRRKSRKMDEPPKKKRSNLVVPIGALLLHCTLDMWLQYIAAPKFRMEKDTVGKKHFLQSQTLAIENEAMKGKWIKFEISTNGSAISMKCFSRQLQMTKV